jgi:hypothetical protein
MRKSFKISMFVLALCTTAVLAQPTNSASGTVSPPVSPMDMTMAWNILIAALVPLAVAGIKKLLPNIPKVAWPVGAALLGILSNWLLAEAGALPHSSWELGALCGAAGVGVREIADQTFGAAKQTIARFRGNGPPAQT